MAEGDNIRNKLQMAEELAKLQAEIYEAENRSLNLSKKQLKANEGTLIAKQQIKSIEQIYNDAIKKGNVLTEKEKNLIKEAGKAAAEKLATSKKELQVEKERVGILKQTANMFNAIGNSTFFKYLMESDSAIKGLNLELGLSGDRAAVMRENIEGAAISAARLGASVQDLAKIQSTFANETGRAMATSGDLLDNVVLIGKGTGLGVENASRMVGQFELMGLTAQQSMDYVQGVVETSELMGVNTTKVLKNISGNFKDLQKFTFRQGVKGFADMATYAEKFKVDMSSMLDSAESARTLEGAVDLAAQLQVMGGEFAKTDPFQLLFLSRNDPAKYTEKINQMTKGVATFKKNAKGGFETFISPMDMDRLEKVGQALGMQRGELAEQSRRMLEIRKMKQQMIGLDKEQMDIVSQGAKRQGDSLKYFVEIAGKRKMLNQLTEEDVRSLKKQNVALEERAKNAKTFDEEFANTINMFKSTMLPILQGINSVLQNNIRPVVDTIQGVLNGESKAIGDMLLVAGKVLAGGLIISKGIGLLGGIVNKIPFGKLGGVLSKSGEAASATGGVASKGGALAGLGKGAGIGLAAAGAGAGIMMASKGIAELANSMSKLNETQIWGLAGVMGAITIAAFPLAGAITTIGTSATVSSLGLVALGAAAVGVGYGINLAATGIGQMAESFATLDGVDLSNISSGLLSIGAASLMVGNPFGVAGIAAISLAVGSLANNADGLQKVGDAFYNIGAVLQGSSSQFKEIRATIDAINNLETGNDSAFANLANLLSKPLKVEFADKDVSLNTSVVLNVDGAKLAESLNIKQNVPTQINRAYQGNKD